MFKNEIGRKQLAVCLISIIILTFLYCSMLYYKNSNVVKIDETWSNGNEILRVYLDYFDDSEKTIKLIGWCVLPEMNAGYAKNYIVFHNLDTNNFYQVNTGFKKRTDVTETINDGYDYNNSGFYASVQKDKLPSGEYEVCILYLGNGKNLFFETQKRFVI